ncbi:unnamed protein product [Effrenium voratum]|nr:unnamed protein product [Effrenium voratum]
MFQGSAEASAAAWFEYFRQVLVARQEARDADADAERRALMAEFLGKGRGEEGRWFIARRWFQQWHSLRCVKSCQQRLANMPSAAGPWCTMGSVLQQWQLHVVSGACRRRARRSRWGGLFTTSSPGDSSLQQHVQVWFREAANTGRLRTKLDRMLFNRRSDAELTEWTLRIWQAWSYETAKTRAFRVMEEAILLRDDGLELCARAAKAQQEAQPPWTLLALWWFWARMPSLQAVENGHKEDAMPASDFEARFSIGSDDGEMDFQPPPMACRQCGGETAEFLGQSPIQQLLEVPMFSGAQLTSTQHRHFGPQVLMIFLDIYLKEALDTWDYLGISLMELLVSEQVGLVEMMQVKLMSRTGASVPAAPGAQPPAAPNQVDVVNQIAQALQQLAVKTKPRDDESSWTSRLGPERGRKWRGGTPPQPPQYKAASNDLRAFARWVKKLEVWKLQASNYMPRNEMALMLFTSLTGEAGQEVEHLDITKVNQSSGVEYIVEHLRSPLEQKAIFQKRSLLNAYEQVARYPNEGVRQYINRYNRIERDLRSLGIETGAMYDSESRGNRVLERCKLAPDLQRLVLIAAGNSLDYERICEALSLQFPDFRPAPQVFHHGKGNGTFNRNEGKGDGRGKPNLKGRGSYNHNSSSSSSADPDRRKVWKTALAEEEKLEAVPEEEFLDDELDPAEEHIDEEDNEEDIPDDFEDNEADEGDLTDLMDVLTVTAKRLQSTVLGRKFTGKRTLAERKRTSSCASCGQAGHWHGDPECPMSAKGKGRGGHRDQKGKGAEKSRPTATAGTPGPSTSYRANANKAFVVNFPDGGNNVVPCPTSSDALENPTFFSYTCRITQETPPTTTTDVHTVDAQAFQIHLTTISDFAGYMVIDTACQRACCGVEWMRSHEKRLQASRLMAKRVESTERFQFGAGGVKTALYKVYLPVALEGQLSNGLVLGVSVLDADMLTSRPLPPDTWQNWRTVVLKLMLVTFKCYRAMSRMVRLGMASRTWLTLAETQADIKEHVDELSLAQKTTQKAMPGTCTHPKFKRYGNMHGSYSQCLRCGQRFKWNPEHGMWVVQTGSSGSSGSLPLPCSGLIMTQAEVRNRSIQGATAKSKAKATSIFREIVYGTPGDDDSDSDDEATFGGRLGPGRRHRDLRHHPGGLRGGDSGAPVRMEPLKKGQRQRLRGEVRRAHNILAAELKLNDTNRQPPRPRSHVDVLEVFAGVAEISTRAPDFGLKSLTPIDYSTGYDLYKQDDADMVTTGISRFRPLYVIMGVDCKDWCLLQDNTNYIRRKTALLARRRKARTLVKRAVDWCKQQHAAGRYFVLENPITSRLWKEKSIVELSNLPGVTSTTCHSGAYNARNSKGDRIRKGFRFLGNCPYVLDRLSRKLTPEELLECVPLQGRETTLSQRYPEEMVNEILTGIRETAEALYPERFEATTQENHKVMAGVVDTNAEKWSKIFSEVQRFFEQTHRKSYLVPHEDPLWSQVKQLVPWQLERLQLVYQPLVMRMPTTFPYTHRGSSVMYNDNEIEHFVEDLSDVLRPRSRFRKPVNFGIFYYGYDMEETTSSTTTPAAEQQPQDSAQQPLPSQVVQDGISFTRPIKLDDNTKRALCRMHRNMGHAHNNELKKLLAMNGINDPAIHDAVTYMKCTSCERTKAPPKPNPTASEVPDFGQFGDKLQGDVFYLRDINSKNYPILGVIDETTHLHVAARLPSRLPTDVAQVLRQLWLTPFGFPLTFKTDVDGSFQAEFDDQLSEGGTFVDFVPPESHHRMGLIERHNATLRTLAERIVDVQAATGDMDIDRVLTAACFAKNSCAWHAGRPPYVAAFGRIPRVGLDLILDPRALACGSTEAEAQQKADVLRAEAQQQLAAMSPFFAKLNLKQMNHLDAPPGSIVAFWRWGHRSGKKRGGYKLGRILGKDPDGQSCWLQRGGSSVKVARHQIRTALGIEGWNPDAEDLKSLKLADENLKSNLLEDEEIPMVEDPDNPIGIDEPLLPEPIGDVPLGDLPLVALPPGKPQPDVANDAVQTDPYLPETRIQIHSPSYRQNIHVQQNFGIPEERRLRQEMSWQHHDRRKLSNHQYHLQMLVNLHYQHAVLEALQAVLPLHSFLMYNKRQQVPVILILVQTHNLWSISLEMMTSVNKFHGHHLVFFLNYQPRPDLGSIVWRRVFNLDNNTVILEEYYDYHMDGKAVEGRHNFMHYQTELWHEPNYTSFMVERDDGYQLNPPGYDGSEDLYMPVKNYFCFNAYRNSPEYDGNGDSDDTDATDTDMQKATSATSSSLTRQQTKQLEKELPWRTIMEGSPEYIDHFVEAVRAEEASFKTWSPLRPLSDDEVKEVLANPRLRRRVMRSRAAYRDKNKGLRPTRAKARVVIIGCTDPDLHELNRECATPTRQAEHVLLTFYISGRNRKLNHRKDLWLLWGGDVKTAFLQGTPEKRPDPIYMYAPRDGIIALAGVFKHQMYQVQGNLYGLACAPRTWSLEVTKRLLAGGYTRHSLDRMLFMFSGKVKGSDKPQLLALVLVYVDDFLVTHSELYALSHLTGMFTWGASQYLSEDQHLDFKGKELRLIKVKSDFVLKITQTKFIESITPGKPLRGRSPEECLKPTDMSEFRSLSGCLQWVAGQSRPDMSAVVSLSNRGAKSTVTDFKNLCDAVKELMETKHDGICIPGLQVNDATNVVIYSDSGWANSADYTSQHGALVLLCEPNCTENVAQAALLDWKSTRSSRVCRSTLAAEASAADMSIDRGSYLSLLVAEILQQIPSFKLDKPLSLRHVTDCKSLYDCICAENPNCEAWIRYVAVAQMERNKSELEQTRANYKLALEEHNAALDSSGLKYEEALEKRVVELKEAEHRYGAATQRRLDASEAIEAKLGLAEAQTALEAEEKCQQEARKYEASLEAMALRQRLSEDRLRAEAQEAEQSEAFVFQRHQSALQAMEQKHQLALKGAEQKIQRALEKHRLELEARYVDEAEKRHQAALAQMQMVIERQKAEMASLERSEEILAQREQLAEARWSAEMEDLRTATAQQHEILSKQRGGQLDAARRAAEQETQHQFKSEIIQRQVLQEAAQLECRVALQKAEQQEELSTQSREAALHATEQKHRLALHLSEQKIQKALDRHRSDLEARYSDALLEKSKDNADLAARCSVLEAELTAAEHKAKSTLATALEVAQQKHQATMELTAARHASSMEDQQLKARERQEAARATEERQSALLRDLEQKHIDAREAAAERLEEALERSSIELRSKHQEETKELAEDHRNEVVRMEAALEAGQIKYQLSVEKYTNLMEAMRQKHDKAMELLRKEMEEKHVTALADVDHQYNHAMVQCEADMESAETRLSIAEEKFEQEVDSMQHLHEFALDKMKSDLEERHAAALSSAETNKVLLEAAETWAKEKHEFSEETAERKEQNAVQRLKKQLEAAELKYQLAVQRSEDEMADLKFQHETVLRSRETALETLAAKLRQCEARHAKSMEIAEEKFRKAFDRVKRCAIEEARQQILEHRRHCRACQQEEPLPLPAPAPLPAPPPKPKPKPAPQLTPRHLREVAPMDLPSVETALESLTVQRSQSWLWAQDMQRLVDRGLEGILELHEAMILLLEQAARHSLLQGQEDPRAESRIASVKQLVEKVSRVNDDLTKLRSDRAGFWFALHQTAEEAVQYLRQAHELPAPGPAVVKRLDFEIEELGQDQKRLAEAFSDLAMRLKTAGSSLDSLQEARSALPKRGEEAEALDHAGTDARDLIRTSSEVVSALLGDVRDLFYLVDGSNLRPRLRPHASLAALPDVRPLSQSLLEPPSSEQLDAG